MSFLVPTHQPHQPCQPSWTNLSGAGLEGSLRTAAGALSDAQRLGLQGLISFNGVKNGVII